MKRILLVLVLLCTTIAQSQKIFFEKEVNKISKKIEHITKSQKDSLKTKIIAIDKQLEKGELTKTTAATLKKEEAVYHARRIEKLVGEQEKLLQILVQDKTNGKIASLEDDVSTDVGDNTFTIDNKIFSLNINKKDKVDSDKRRKNRWKEKNKKQRSTTTQFVFAMGVNNVLMNDDLNSLNNSEYKFWKSHFYEVGWTWKTRFKADPSIFYLKYGVSFLWNNLRLKDNKIHVKNGNVTEINTYGNQLSESRLRHVQMSFPVHLEWDFSKNKTYKDGRVKDRTNKSVRFGVGGFVGFKLGTRQYLEYRNTNGVDVKEVQFDNFNMNIFNYGVSTYIGYKSTSFYVKYDLNPLFKNISVR